MCVWGGEGTGCIYEAGAFGKIYEKFATERDRLTARIGFLN